MPCVRSNSGFACAKVSNCARCSSNSISGFSNSSSVAFIFIGFRLLVNRQRASFRSAIHTEMPIPIMTKANGKPVASAAACIALSPPPSRRAIATNPSALHQKTRCTAGASNLPPAVIVSTTSEPESEEVTKKMISRTILTNEASCVNGSCSKHFEEGDFIGPSCNPFHHASVAIGEKLVDGGAAKSAHAEQDNQHRQNQDTKEELTHRASLRNTSDERSNERAPGNPPCKMER